MNLQIAISGVSSFTALWIANALADYRETALSPFLVQGLMTKQLSQYQGLKARRLRRLDARVTVHDNIQSQDGTMARWIRTHRPAIWIHHHHHMQNYRLPSYDLVEARAIGINPLGEIIEALKTSGCRGVIYSGSHFEPEERGQGKSPTSYAESKTEAWNCLKSHCIGQNLPLTKIVIPNPVGPFENADRMIPRLLSCAETGVSFNLNNGNSVSEFISVKDLADLYVSTALAMLSPKYSEVAPPTNILRPLGHQISNREMVALVVSELIENRMKLDVPPLVQEGKVLDHLKALKNASKMDLKNKWKYFWDFYFQEHSSFRQNRMTKAAVTREMS